MNENEIVNRYVREKLNKLQKLVNKWVTDKMNE